MAAINVMNMIQFFLIYKWHEIKMPTDFSLLLLQIEPFLINKWFDTNIIT